MGGGRVERKYAIEIYDKSNNNLYRIILTEEDYENTVEELVEDVRRLFRQESPDEHKWIFCGQIKAESVRTMSWGQSLSTKGENDGNKDSK